MLKKYGEDSFALLVDEGSEYQDTDIGNFALSHPVGVYGDMGGSIFAVPGTTEKGYVDIRVTVSAPGGHSSVPPLHTVTYKYHGN